MRELIKAFKVLSDETRLRALSLILEHECCVCEIMKALNISQSKASRDLTALYDAGFLKVRKEGVWSYYSLDTKGATDYHAGLAKIVQEALKDNAIIMQDKQKLISSTRASEKCAKCII